MEDFITSIRREWQLSCISCGLSGSFESLGEGSSIDKCPGCGANLLEAECLHKRDIFLIKKLENG